MNTENSVVAIYNTHEEAEHSIRDAPLSMARLRCGEYFPNTEKR